MWKCKSAASVVSSALYRLRLMTTEGAKWVGTYPSKILALILARDSVEESDSGGTISWLSVAPPFVSLIVFINKWA